MEEKKPTKEGEAKSQKPTGRPSKDPEVITFNGWQMLEAICLYLDASECARELNMSRATLYRHIKERYDCSFETFKETIALKSLKARLFKEQVETALDGNPMMQVWLGKQILGQTDKPKEETNDQSLPDHYVITDYKEVEDEQGSVQKQIDDRSEDE